MTYEEASKDTTFIIKCLEKRRMLPCGFCRSDKCIPNPHECAADDFVINAAIDAIEKQMPKKPKNIRSSNDYRLAEHNIFDGDCPVCGERITGNYYGEFCGCCGQAIDWSEVYDRNS